MELEVVSSGFFKCCEALSLKMKKNHQKRVSHLQIIKKFLMARDTRKTMKRGEEWKKKSIKFLQLLQCSIFHNNLRTFTALQVLLDILLLTLGASEDYEIVFKTLNSRYSIWINSFFCSLWKRSFSQRWFDVYQRCKTRR